ncbi:MAG: hypothetical protein LLG04_07775 [Parachlamydia sp.]|nr:hypothetical protein [Parachlamydia sp.]
MQPAGSNPCPICDKALTSRSLFHPAGITHPMHSKCFLQMMKTMKECPICHQSTANILQGFKLHSAQKLAELEAFERLEELDEQLNDEYDLINGYNEILSLENESEGMGIDAESVILKTQREQVETRRDALLKRRKDLVDLLRVSQLVVDLVTSPDVIVIEGRPYIHKLSDVVGNMNANLARSNTDNVETDNEQKKTALQAYRHLGALASGQIPRREMQLKRIDTFIERCTNDYNDSCQLQNSLSAVEPKNVSDGQNLVKKLQELLQSVKQLSKMILDAEGQRKELSHAVVFCKYLQRLDQTP